MSEEEAEGEGGEEAEASKKARRRGRTRRGGGGEGEEGEGGNSENKEGVRGGGVNSIQKERGGLRARAGRRWQLPQRFCGAETATPTSRPSDFGENKRAGRRRQL